MTNVVHNGDSLKKIIELVVEQGLDNTLDKDYPFEVEYTLDAQCAETNTHMALDMGKDLLSFALTEKPQEETFFTAIFKTRGPIGDIVTGPTMTYDREYIQAVYLEVMSEKNNPLN